MDRQMRIQLLVDHYKRPRHKGPLEGADVSMPGGNPGCGDVVRMHLEAADGGDRLEAMRFEGEGCTISQAAASILAQRMNKERASFQEILELSYEEMIELLGRDIVGSRPRCATLALGTLKAAVKRLEMDRKLRAAGRSDEEIAAMREAVAAQAGGGLVFGEGAEQRAKEGASPRPDPLGAG